MRRMPGFLPVSTKAFCSEVKSPNDHNARLSPAAVEATTAWVNRDLKKEERAKLNGVGKSAKVVIRKLLPGLQKREDYTLAGGFHTTEN